MAKKTRPRLYAQRAGVAQQTEPQPIEAKPEHTANPLLALQQVIGNHTVHRMIQRRQLPLVPFHDGGLGVSPKNPQFRGGVGHGQRESFLCECALGTMRAGHVKLGNQTIQHLLTASPSAAQRSVAGRQGPSPIQREGDDGRTTIRYDGIPTTGLHGGDVVLTWQPGLQTPTKSTNDPLPFPRGGTTTPVGDRPVKIFDITRGPKDLLSLRLPPSTGRTREEAPPEPSDEEGFSEEELRDLQEEEEMRRAPEMFERVAAGLDEAYEEIGRFLNPLYEAAKPAKLDVSDLVERDLALERKLKRRSHEVYLDRETIRAEIEALTRDADRRLKLVKALVSLLDTFERSVDDIRIDLEAIDSLLANERTRNRKKHLITIREFWDEFGKIENRSGQVIAQYLRIDAVAELTKMTGALTTLSKDVKAFGGVVEDAQPYGSGGIDQALGSAKTIVMVGRYGKLTQSVYKRIDSTVLPDRKLQDLLDNVTAGQGGQGVKGLSGKIKGGYTHELKFLGSLGGNRIFGKIDKSDGRVLFTKYGAHL